MVKNDIEHHADLLKNEAIIKPVVIRTHADLNRSDAIGYHFKKCGCLGTPEPLLRVLLRRKRLP